MPPDAPRVLVVGAGHGADSMEAHVVEALRELGCDTALFVTTAWYERLGRAAVAAGTRLRAAFAREPELAAEPGLLRAVARHAPALVLVLQGNQLAARTVERLRTVTTAPVVCWCQDAMTSFGRQHLLGAGYDLVFLKDRYLVELFARMLPGTQFRYLPEACNPRVHRLVTLTDADRARYGCEVTVIGSLYHYRQELLRTLQGVDLRLWGTRYAWMPERLPGRHGGAILLAEDKARALLAARIALDPLHYAEVDALNCRAFEQAGCGAFQLVSSRPVLERHFVPGVEVETFDSAAELRDKVHHYLANPDAAAAIAARGQARAHAEHTYVHRLRELLASCGLALPARVGA